MRYVLLFLCCCLLSSAGAQIHQAGQRFIEVGGGLTNRMQLIKPANSGYRLKASLGKYGKKEGSYQLDLITQKKYYQPNEKLTAVNQYFLGGTFSPKAFSTTDRQFYIHPALGILIGYEATRSEEAFSSDTVAVNPNKFLVGVSGGLNGEWNMTSQMAFLVFARVNYLPSSAIEHFHFHYGIGIRFNYFKN
ncbi:conjugal transfer protein TraO [Rhodocytophaga aerolata]|uniref:Conjugal transfer protein TraO n=1 Tax=Rhodocytophaga aerolata TaxID=455078 RepID=A0ABT8QYD3_9BACT|nr:conjugal transfer protein TraO [Rhodocytophaga aerolata]MDO1444679.1 conjugal transfer protein TraO [Rhodocytophaga aerolata]